MSSLIFLFFVLSCSLLPCVTSDSPMCHNHWFSPIQDVEDARKKWEQDGSSSYGNVQCSNDNTECFTIHCIYKNNPAQYVNFSGCIDANNNDCVNLITHWLAGKLGGKDFDVWQMKCAECKKTKSQPEDSKDLVYPGFPTTSTIRTTTIKTTTKTSTFEPAPLADADEDYDNSAAAVRGMCTPILWGGLLAAMAIRVMILMCSLGGIEQF